MDFDPTLFKIKFLVYIVLLSKYRRPICRVNFWKSVRTNFKSFQSKILITSNVHRNHLKTVHLLTFGPPWLFLTLFNIEFWKAFLSTSFRNILHPFSIHSFHLYFLYSSQPFQRKCWKEFLKMFHRNIYN